MKESTRNRLGCLVWIVVILCFWGGCQWYDSYKEAKRKEAVKDKVTKDSIRRAFVKDSLEHDPHYVDSMARVEKERKIWEEEEKAIRQTELIGFVLIGDSVYHTCMHDVHRHDGHRYNFTLQESSAIRFVTSNDIENGSYEMCSECSEIEDAYIKYNDGELFTEDDTEKHDLIPVDEACEYCNMAKEYDDDRW